MNNHGGQEHGAIAQTSGKVGEAGTVLEDQAVDAAVMLIEEFEKLLGMLVATQGEARRNQDFLQGQIHCVGLN